MKRVISLLMAILFVVGAVFLGGCAGKEYPPIITYGQKSVSINMFNYIFSLSKTMALSNLGITQEQEEELWQSSVGEVFAQEIKNDAVNTAMSMAYFADIAEKEGIQLTKQEQNSIEDQMDQMLTQYKVNKNGFNEMMSVCGANYDVVKDFLTLQLLANKGKEKALGQNGVHAVTEQEYLDYYNQNFVTVRHICVNNVNKVEANDKVVVLTDEEKAVKDAQIEDIMMSLASGQDLSDFAEFSSDDLLKYQPQGVTIPLTTLLYQMAYIAEESQTPFNFYGLYYYFLQNISGFSKAVTEGKQGEYQKLQSDKGMFIIQCLPIDMQKYESYKSIFSQDGSVEAIKIIDLMQQMKDEFVIDQANLDSFTAQNVSSCPIPTQAE